MIESKDDTPKIESKFMERTKPLEKQMRGVSQGPPGAHMPSKQMNVRSGSESGLNQAALGDSKVGIQPAHKIIIPNDDPTKTSTKRTGVVRAYAANTN
jgi:hypothetical protein